MTDHITYLRRATIALVATIGIALTSCVPSSKLTGVAGTYVASLQANVTGPSAPFCSGEAVTLGGGAGVDWTPTKGSQTRALLIGSTGNVKVDFADGTTAITLTGLATGQLVAVSAIRVYSSADGTTASAITALY